MHDKAGGHSPGPEPSDAMTQLGEEVVGAVVPLATYYRSRGCELPRFDLLPEHRLPEPQRRLLNHGHDMTPTLAAHHGVTLGLQVLYSMTDTKLIDRTVALVRASDGVPVAFGSIRIYLERIAGTARQSVLAGREPLGALLAAHGIGHTSHPQAFFQVVSDQVMAEALACARGILLHGRHNELRDVARAPLARVIEILPQTVK